MTSGSNRAQATAARVRGTRLAVWMSVTALLVVSFTTVMASDRDEDDEREPSGSYAIGLWGDVPYSEVQETGVANLIKDMNQQRLAFTVHDGDLKQGNGAPVCDNALYSKALDNFNSLKAPAMFTPGDNDWTDC